MQDDTSNPAISISVLKWVVSQCTLTPSASIPEDDRSYDKDLLRLLSSSLLFFVLAGEEDAIMMSFLVSLLVPVHSKNLIITTMHPPL